MPLAVVIVTASPRLPTDGYVRPGRYFPVEVRTDDGPLTLSADGCVPTDVAAGFRGTVPVLAITTPTGGLAGTPLRSPADGERLVAATTALPPGAAELFPGDRLLPVRLDPADPLPGPPAAWEVLDAVVLDPAAMAAVPDAKRSALLAGGVTLAVTGDDRPDARWPWRRRGPLWALAIAPAGPTADVVSPDAYAPTESWSPGWPAAVRGGAVAVAGGIGIVTIALFTMGERRLRRGRTPRPTSREVRMTAPHPQRERVGLRLRLRGPAPVTAKTQATAGRLRQPQNDPTDRVSEAGLATRSGVMWTLAAVAFPLVSGAGVVLWRSRLDPVARVRGDVTVTSPVWSQRDAWVYERARSTAVATVPWAGWTHPAFPSPTAAAQARLTVSADGATAFRVPLAAGSAMAFVRREIGPATARPPVTGGHGAAMRSIASLYLQKGDRVAGETPAPPGGWPGVAITRP